ncbi:MAG TPA: ribosome assembly factor SBDS [Nitrososphaeraceae archaeon]|jgi:ribosome maturation protein SDO1|nr:ribosome assembly factor SBDS [Nitrososphaeraceae archaeon]
MTDNKFSIVRLMLNADRFEILVKPDPALDYKLGKKVDISNILISDEIYSDANKGTRVPYEKLIKNFKTKDQIEIAKHILEHGDVNLTTDQRRRMVDEKKKQITQYISRNFIDPKTHLPHPPLRVENAMEQIRLVIDPFKRPEEQAKKIIDDLRKILPLKSENLQLVITIPPQFSSQSYSIIKGLGDLKDEKWLQDGSLKVIIEINAGLRLTFIERVNSITKGSAHIQEQ